MVEAWVTITNRLGLHARAAAKLVHLAEGFASSVHIHREDGSATADAKSILGVLLLAASKSGTRLRVVADGPDEAAALAAVTTMFADGFGENG
jgi:phosphotransferase system HPr (HPr) family protein